MSEHFNNFTVERPSFESLKASFDAVLQSLDSATSENEHISALQSWEKTRQSFRTWSSMTNLKFMQDTSDENAKDEREFADELRPKFTELEVDLKRKFLDLKEGLSEKYGSHVFRLWENDILTYEPAIQDDMVEEAKRSSDYVELKAAAKLEFRGETYNLSTFNKFLNDADRDTRYEANKCIWSWVEDNAEAFDTIYDDLVTIRTRKARKLGHDNFVKLGYQSMQRVDYNADDVKRFRDEVIENVVPLAAKIRDEQRKTLGLDTLMKWDEGVHDLTGNPKPSPDYDTLIDAATQMFDGMHPEIGTFFRMMNERGLLDLKSRDGKSGGGFCTYFADEGVPFVFANFNGTKHDVEVFTHEIGHAFQNYLSNAHELSDYHWPTYESAEIHSMSLEFLTWPHMEKFFGEDAERFQRIHLKEGLVFMPYGCAIDHFQHEVYANPDMTPADRHDAWKKIEQTYMPWRNWGDLSHPAKGGMWQMQSHVFGAPFYYIDYVLAQTCALQFWDQMQNDYDDALTRYVTLCRRGGEAPFQALATSAGLKSPFSSGCLSDVVKRAESFLF